MNQDRSQSPEAATPLYASLRDAMVDAAAIRLPHTGELGQRVAMRTGASPVTARTMLRHLQQGRRCYKAEVVDAFCYELGIVHTLVMPAPAPKELPPPSGLRAIPLNPVAKK